MDFQSIASEAIIDKHVSRVKRETVGLKTNISKLSLTLTKDGATTSKKRLSNKEKSKTPSNKEIHKHLQNLRSILRYSNATPIQTHSGLGYACGFCSTRFLNPNELKQHTLDNHRYSQIKVFMKGHSLATFAPKVDITSLQCTLCNTEISQLEQLLIHLMAEHNKEVYTNVNNHIMPFKFESEDFKCAVCEKQFEYFKHLQEHMSFHYRNYLCNTCNAPFMCMKTLRRHNSRHKQGEFQCSLCSKVFDTKTKKNAHERFVHNGNQKRNKCPYCSEKFTHHQKKKQHMAEEHGEKPLELKCNACSLTFRSRDGLTRHTKRDHLMERQHECPLCDMRFFGKCQLQNHMIKHTGERQFSCDICLKAYPRKKTLREHMRIHIDDRRFKCQICGQTFIQKCSWKSHMLSKHLEMV